MMRRGGTGAAGAGFLMFVLVLAVTAPWVAPYDPLAQDLEHALQLPSADHWLGTDDLGRDLLSRLMLGTRVSVAVGFGSAALALVIGTAAGLIAGYQAGWLGATIMRVSDVLLAFPAVLLAMLVATVLKAGISGVILSHAVMLEQRHRPYVDAAIAFGASPVYIIVRAVLPNVLAPLIVQTAFTIANAVLLEAGLSFLGLGIQPPHPSLGLMLQEARGYIRSDAWFGICPGLLLLLIVLALNAAADTLGQLADPRGAIRAARAAL
jgi:peptide/nickel transport system permease protein